MGFTRSLETRWCAGFLCVAAALLGAQSMAWADDDDVITYRQLIMKEMDAEASALGMIVSGQIPTDALVSQTKALALSAKGALKAFERKVPGGDAKPEVWAKWDDFSKRMQTLTQNTDELTKSAEAGNLSAFAEKMTDALTCKQCHETYRVKKKT